MYEEVYSLLDSSAKILLGEKIECGRRSPQTKGAIDFMPVAAYDYDRLWQGKLLRRFGDVVISHYSGAGHSNEQLV